MLAVEVIAELGGVDRCAGKEPLHELGAAKLGRVRCSLDFVLVLVGHQRSEVVKHRPQRPEHAA
jgi:hypothetical protein